MVERLWGEGGAEKCSIPLAIVLTKPGQRCQATSCLPRGKGGEPGSSSRQLDFKPQALSSLHFSFSLHLSFSFVSVYITHSTPSPKSLLSSEHPHSYPISALDSPPFSKASRRPIKCCLLDHRRMEYGADLARSQSSLPSDETLNLPFASFCPALTPLYSYKVLHLLFQSMSCNCPHKLYTFSLT